MSAKASGASTGPNGTATNRQHHDGSAGRAYTADQKAAVLRVRRCKATAFYDILGLEAVKATCSESEIKKAYRKLSLLTHPDKNGFEGADEAFKMVSRAFQILSDADKKAQYDRYGQDPDNRFASQFASAGANPFSGFASPRGGRGGPMFEEEISPEELFRQFFGGGGGMFGGGPMGGGFGGPSFVFNMGGGPGFRVHQFGGGQPRRRPQGANGAQRGEETTQSFSSILTSLLPLLLFFIFPLLNGLFSSSTPSGPSFRFDAPSSPYTKTHTSKNLGVKYYVNPAEVAEYSGKQWGVLDSRAERGYLGHLNSHCEWEREERSRKMEEARGWFFPDVGKLQEARNMKLKRCEELNKLTRRQGW